MAVDPLIMAQLEAAIWCEAVVRQAAVVAEARKVFDGAMRALENVADRADRAVREANAMKSMREPV